MTRLRRSLVRTAAPLALASLVAATLTSCGDPEENYCSALKDHQKQLTNTLSQGGTKALIQALPVFEDLQDQAPSDIAKDWKTVVTSLTGLQKVLDAAHVDPDDFKNGTPPKGLSAADTKAIVAAATKVGSKATQTASVHVQQQARDVCHTPLTL